MDFEIMKNKTISSIEISITMFHERKSIVAINSIKSYLTTWHDKNVLSMSM